MKKTTPLRDARGRILKGQSGNPGGRPKTPVEIKALLEERGGRAAERLLELVDSEDERISLTAAMAVLDRLLGKPRIEISNPKGDRLAEFVDMLAGRSAPKTDDDDDDEGEA